MVRVSFDRSPKCLSNHMTINSHTRESQYQEVFVDLLHCAHWWARIQLPARIIVKWHVIHTLTYLPSNIVLDILFYFRQCWTKEWSNAHANTGASPLAHTMLHERYTLTRISQLAPSYLMHTQITAQLCTQCAINNTFVDKIQWQSHFPLRQVKHSIDFTVLRIAIVAFIVVVTRKRL